MDIMDVVIDSLIFILVVIAIFLFGLRLRFKLLSLWKDVSIKEVIFHKLLLETTILFSDNKNLFIGDEYQPLFKKLSKYKKKKLRHLLLKERQDLFLSLNTLFNDMEELEDEKYAGLISKFNELQKARRILNSKVLLYNQTISVFPTRFLALKLNLQLKEYFG